MLSFSQRKGIKPIRKSMQIDSMDDKLRTRLWNVLTKHCWSRILSTTINDDFRKGYIRFLSIIWDGYFNWETDTLSSYYQDSIKIIKEHFFDSDWDEVYSFIEFIANNYPPDIEFFIPFFIKSCNKVLKNEMSAYRFVEKKIVQITSKEEISEIEEVLQVSIDPIKTHIKCALEHLSNRKSPDYRNSIKESISAVESICKLITNDENATLGEALKQIEKEGKIKLHTALKSAFDKLYGYTSSKEAGIRHALLNETESDLEDAKFMLVSCSAFINYLLEKTSKAGIKIS